MALAKEGWTVQVQTSLPGATPSTWYYHVGFDTEPECEGAARIDPRVEPGSKIQAVRRLTVGDIAGLKLQEEEVRDADGPPPANAS